MIRFVALLTAFVLVGGLEARTRKPVTPGRPKDLLHKIQEKARQAYRRDPLSERDRFFRVVSFKREAGGLVAVAAGGNTTSEWDLFFYAPGPEEEDSVYGMAVLVRRKLAK